MNSSQYRKLPRHYIDHQKFYVELSQAQAKTLALLLPKGCSLVIEPKARIASQQRKPKHEQPSYMIQESSSNRMHPSVKQQPIQSKPKQKKPQIEIPEAVKPCFQILQQLKSHKSGWPFLEPVDAQVLGIPEYYEIVTEPMDLSTVEQKYKSGQYKTPQQFYKDINLMIKNSYDFNQMNEEFIKITADFERYFFRIAGAEAKPVNDKKLEKEKQRERERLQKERLKEEKIKEKLMQKEKEKERKLLQQQQQQAQLALRLAKKKKKQLPKDLLEAQNIPTEQKLELAANIHSLPKEHLKGIRNIVFDAQKLEQPSMSDQIHEFDIEKIGYKKIRELQKYVRAKLNEIENSKFCDQMSEKKDEIDLDEMESEWTEEFID